MRRIYLAIPLSLSRLMPLLPYPRHTGAHADGYVSLHFALALLLQVPRGPLPPSPFPPSFARRGVTMPSHSWYCYRYCYYYRYCCGRVANGKAEGRWSPAAMLSAALEANYTRPPPPPFARSAYRNLYIPPLFRKVSFRRNVREKK